MVEYQRLGTKPLRPQSPQTGAVLFDYRAGRLGQNARSHGLALGRPSVDLGQRQRSFGAHAMFSGTWRRLPSPFSSARAKRSPPCIRGSVFRSSQRQLPGLLRASCWGLQVSLSIQRQPRRLCTANTSVIPPIASQGQASCSGLVRWRALRSVITPVAT